MASKKSSKKRYPVQRHIEITGLGANKAILDGARFLSESNHRLYRQSRVYRCKINQIDPAQDGRQLEVYVLRDTWWLQKAYQMAKAKFDENTKEERSGMSPVNMARWQDFRINLTPAAGVTYDTLLPTVRNNGTTNSSTLSNGEFVDSLVTKENSTDMSFGLFEITNARWSIIGEYDKTADVDDDPANLVSGSNISAYDGLDDDNDSGLRNHLQTAGNSPPYDPDSLGADTMLRRVAILGGNGANQKLSTGFFDAPLGFVLLVSQGANGSYEIEFASGDYKGVHAVNYLE
jgi:hypothetical protein